MDPTRVLILGDVHGERGWFKHIVKVARKQDCPVILQAGDFGYWEHVKWGKAFLDEANDVLGDDLTCVWVDGNHENHTVLRLNYGPGGNRYNPTEEGFWPIRPRLLYAPRGHRWTWQGRKFMAMGGGYSIDEKSREPGISWWPEELITDEEVDIALASKEQHGRVDVLVTHDAPTQVQVGLSQRSKDMFWQTIENRKHIDELVRGLLPHLVIHGHYHWRHSSKFSFRISDDYGIDSHHEVRVEGLGRDGDMQRAWAVLELPSLGIEPQYPVEDQFGRPTKSW